MSPKGNLGSAIPLVMTILIAPRMAAAQTSVPPGQTVNITQAAGGSTSCQISFASASCALLRFSGTTAVSSSNTVNAHYDQLLPAVGAANYATASLFTDFDVPGPPSTLVNVQVSTTFDLQSRLFGAGAYKTAIALSMKVSDLSVSSVPIPLAAHPLFETERSGDQGVTDVTGGDETQVIFDDTSSFHVTLRRGHRYRLTFELQVLGEALVVGKVISDAQATWTRSRISVDEDEVDLLTLHDTAVRTDLAAHDQAVRGALATHDSDIKQKLAEILAKLDEQSKQLAEIKQLLLTPQGRRDGFPIK
jgi:hypothetical protein